MNYINQNRLWQIKPEISNKYDVSGIVLWR
jgi:hypothetical protein